jgi:hypothetical protein
MAHFAQINENNEVIQVIVVANSDCGELNFPESETVGQTFLASLGLDGVWKQTSYNSNFRVRYAGISAVYLEEQDMFTHPKPFPSWSLDSEHEWQPPTPKPTEDGYWVWNETAQQWER